MGDEIDEPDALDVRARARRKLGGERDKRIGERDLVFRHEVGQDLSGEGLGDGADPHERVTIGSSAAF